MKVQKSNNILNKYFSNTQYKNKIYESLMNDYLNSNNLETNNMDENEIKKKFLLNNIKNLLDSDEIIIQDNENGKEYTKMKYISPINNKYNDYYSRNDSRENWRKKLFFQKNSFSTKNKDLIVENQKRKRKILSSDNDNFRNNQISFNKTSYPINKYINNDEEPFYFDDKYISNSFIINHDDKPKKYKYNGYNENSSKLLSKDLPSSLNNTDRYTNSKNDNEDNINGIYNKNKIKYESYDYPSENITFREKGNIYNKDNDNKTIETEKIKNPTKIIKSNIRNKHKKFFQNLTENNINFNTSSNFNSHNTNNNNLDDFKLLNNINKTEEFKNLRDTNEISSDDNIQKININIPKTNNNLKKLLFNNNTDNNPINEPEYKNNKLIDNKNTLNKSGNWENYDIF